MQAIIARLKEPSTFAGIAVLLGMFGINVAPEVLQPVIQIVTAGASLAAVMMGERK